MSLLMDALKKAELAKRQGQGEGAGAGEPTQPDTLSGLRLEPIPATSPLPPVAPSPTTENLASGDILPHLPSHLEDLDAQFLAEAKEAASARLKAPPPQAPAREQSVPQPPVETAPRQAPLKTRTPAPEQNTPQSQSAAKNVFAAKQADKPPARKAFAIAVGVLTVLSVCGIGGYFWWQLQPKSLLVAQRPPPPPSASAVSAPLPMPQPTPAAGPVAPIPSPAAAATTPPRPAPSSADDGDDDAPPSATGKTTPVRRPATAPASPPEQEAPIRVSRTPLKVNPALTRGYEAFNRGDLTSAQNEYERAQKSDPRNTDALHGLAAIAVRQGRLDQAELLYRRITEADPQDTVAASALINMRAQIDPHAAESRLKSMSAAQPELAAPHFSLGNLYARDGRWSDAQQAYFRAYSAEPDNPDILYNLAISLEHLRQNKLAAQYYAQAIAAAQNRPAGFDKAQASTRLRTLQP